MPLTFDNTQSLGIESEWSESVGLNLSTNGVKYIPDPEFNLLNNIINTTLDSVETLDIYKNKSISYSSDYEYGNSCYVTDFESRKSIGNIESTFNQYLVVESGFVSGLEYSSFAINQNNVVQTMKEIISLYGHSDVVIINDNEVPQTDDVLDIETLLSNKDIQEFKFIWNTSEGTRTVYFTPDFTENGSFHILYTAARIED